MTLTELFKMLGEQPMYIVLFFSMLPFTALVAGLMGRGDGHLAPWKYLYSALIYLVSVPAIFAVALSVYLFLFERRSVMQTDVLTQILPVISMVLTLWLIGRNVHLDRIPGFGKLSGLIMMIVATFGIMWFLDRIKIFAFTRIPFYSLVLIFIALLIAIRFGWSKIAGGESRNEYYE